MAENTKIEWATHTWNPWFGCTKVGPPCDNCYAEALMDNRLGRVNWGAGNDRVRTSQANWKLPLKWDRAAAIAGEPATVFCLSLGDIWDNEVDPAWRRAAFDVMDETPHLIYLLLSKRVGNAEKMTDAAAGHRPLPENCALGATMANQEEYDRDRIKLEHAGATLAAKFTFASVEPMLGPLILDRHAPDWIICGGESGPHARMMELQWARNLRDSARRFDRAFFFKQTTRKGPIPPDLMVREFPR